MCVCVFHTVLFFVYFFFIIIIIFFSFDEMSKVVSFGTYLGNLC